jgi:hypothetical protein
LAGKLDTVLWVEVKRHEVRFDLNAVGAVCFASNLSGPISELRWVVIGVYEQAHFALSGHGFMKEALGFRHGGQGRRHSSPPSVPLVEVVSRSISVRGTMYRPLGSLAAMRWQALIQLRTVRGETDKSLAASLVETWVSSNSFFWGLIWDYLKVGNHPTDARRFVSMPVSQRTLRGFDRLLAGFDIAAWYYYLLLFRNVFYLYVV